MDKAIIGIRGTFFDFLTDPWQHIGQEGESARFYADGLLVIENGIIQAYGPYERLSPQFSGIDIHHIKERLILPGFVDGHVHMPQTRVLGAFGQHLLGWLQQWVFPEELKYSDPAYAQLGARQFFDNLLAAGTTTCQAFTTANPVCTEAFFEEASRRNMLVIGGITGLDRFAPAESMDTPANFYRDSKRLLAQYHRKGRNLYAVTPRFAFASSHDLMSACQRLKNEHPDVYINTHISETPIETRETISLHQVADYLAAYEKYHLVGPRFTGGHGCWLADDEFRRLSRAEASLSFCPSSNLFLGSGFFRLGRATDPQYRVKLSFGCDIGGGNRLSLINVLDEAYKVGMWNHLSLDGSIDPSKCDPAEAERNILTAYRAFWSITLGGAEALYLADRIGNFDPGKEADFVVLDWNAGQRAMSWHQSLLLQENGARPMSKSEAADLLFAIMTIGDDRNVEETWIMGKRLYKKQTVEPALTMSH